MTVVVVDSSAIVNFLSGGGAFGRIGEILMADPSALHAPHLVYLEVVSALRQMVFEKRIDRSRASAVLVDFEALSIERHSHEHLIHRVWQLRDNLTPYDASY